MRPRDALVAAAARCYHGAVAEPRRPNTDSASAALAAGEAGDTLHDASPAGAELSGATLIGAPAAGATPGHRPVFTSMKPQHADAQRTPVVAAIDRPEMRPRLRAISETPRPRLPPGDLGRYAGAGAGTPPRAQLSPWLCALVVAVAALLGAAVTWLLRAG
ncbi:hypothetical protein [Haliangium ochraceum]|uniref:Uncharacterized protein n=1 Tax=Haliangium ochraceum (strain DSM 14365 / JCM 11303 / SMP-2) TaxID=502025 RepID=D0LZ82_HALO1|nr:hypothetical protein [Haliangium ochraceum]ACY16344.1 conserved hypothetical protein [Haliangium ochraceum DSM 14365]